VLNLNTTQCLADVFISYRYPSVSRQYAQAVAITLRKIIKNLVLNKGLKIGELDLVSDEDKQKMISWNPKVPYGQMTCMHYLVEAVARAIPASEAVCAWDGSLTYGQLDALSSIAAEQLVRVGVGPGIYVPFTYEKSLWTVVATLAILKAGGAFVPLDPMHPRARLEEILNSINAKVVVASDAFAPTLQDLVEHVVVISAETVSTHQHGEIHCFSSAIVGPKDPIFVLFTSGSTGRPKGMIHEHGAICTHAITHGEAMGYQGARVLQFAAHTFDVAIIDIFTTLIFGGCICIPSEEDRRSNIVGVIGSMKADYAILTPSFAGLIVPAEVPTLTTLAIGGEALPEDRIQRWAEKVSLIQIYGPAEVGICLIMHMHPRKTLPETVGHTLRNSSCWLVDPNDPHRLVPIGTVGELVVAGPSLARGYLNDEAKTRSSFLPNLDWADRMGLKCGRFYMTGDLLRYNTDSFDGAYDFVGRKDAQIKLRGQRIEPGEVEHHIASIPGVAISMVTRPDQGCFAGELVAVVQMRSAQASRVLSEPISITLDQSLSLKTVRQHVSRSLPGYMIPTVCLVVNSMPFVPSLKIDRRLVDAWLRNMKSRPSEIAVATEAGLEASYLHPGETTANLLSLKIAELVASKDTAKRLMLERHDFGLQKAGIDSIQIISLSMFLQREYGTKTPMQTLLSSTTTIRDLAYLVDHRNRSSAAYEVPATVNVRQEVETLSKRLFRDIEAQTKNSHPEPCAPIRNVFLTGASGYLGSAILQHLVARPHIQILALVRCPTESAGLQRIKAAAIKTGWWQDCHSTRIQVWPGDLTADNLGLNSQQLQRLRGNTTNQAADLCIHAIIHNGARVHYSSSYSTLKPPNIHPTLSLLQTTAQAPHLSSFVFVSGGQNPNLPTDRDQDSEANAHLPHSADGYAQSKFVSESLIQKCLDHPSFCAKRICTVKPGYIVGSLHAGIANQSDFLWRLVAGCLETGAYNRDEAARWLFVADVESVASAVVEGVFHDKSCRSGQVERVLTGLRLGELWDLLRSEFGYELVGMGWEEWMERLKGRVVKEGEGHLLFPLLHVLEREGGRIGGEVEEEEEDKVPAVSVAAPLENLRMRDVMARNVRHLIDVGFLPLPGAAEWKRERISGDGCGGRA
jgi:amino acid adenylation domain-containing protein/thioester reductase-like protein